jgi:hypothetical protein
MGRVTGTTTSTIHEPAVAPAPQRHARRTVAVLVAAALVAALVFLVVYPRVGFDADSVTYIGVGRNIAEGHGATYPFKSPGARMTDFPPGYPLVLGAADAAGLPIVGFAHVFQALMLGVAGALAAWLVLRASRSAVFAAIAFLLVVAAPGLGEVFSTVYTEPLAIVLGLGALAFLVAYAHSPRVGYLVGAGVCAGISPVVRWVGVSVIATGVLVLLVIGAGVVRDRVKRAAAWGALSLVPAALVAATNRNHGNSSTARKLAWHPIGWSQARQGFDTVASWFLPRQLSDRWIAGAVIVGVVFLLVAVWLVRRGATVARRALGAAGPAVVVPGAFVVVYLATIVVSVSLFDAATPLDTRILAPLYAALVPTVIGGVAVWWSQPGRSRDAMRAAGAVLVVALVLVGVRSLTTATGNQDYRLGYATSHWHHSPLMRQLRAYPKGALVVTNAPEAVYLQTGRHARGLPAKYSSTSLQHDPHYRQQLDALVRRVQARGGVVAMFDEVKGRPWQAKAPELERQTDLRVVARAHDGVLLAARDPGG